MTIVQMIKIIAGHKMSIVPVPAIEKDHFNKASKAGFVIRDDPTGMYLANYDPPELTSPYCWLRMYLDAARFSKRRVACEFAMGYLEMVDGKVE